MCSGAILLYKISRVVSGEHATFMGEEQWLTAHGVELDVRHDPQGVALMTEFITRHPGLRAEDIGE